MMSKILREVDWILIVSILMLTFFGIITMKSFGGESGPLAGGDYFFNRQILWLALGFLVFVISLSIDWNFLKTNSIFLLILYGIVLLLLLFLFLAGHVSRGALSWYKIHSVGVEPVELMKPILVLVLAKYFSKRHAEIGRIFHLLVSGMYAVLPAVFVMLQPALGSATILLFLWLGMALFGGIKFKHLFFLMILGVIVAFSFWHFFLLPYQKQRIISFINPQHDIQGSGYHAIQSTVAIGSGGIFGKGLGFGTQSRLEFLPEHQTDFIFAAFAEEWGLIGVIMIFLFFGMAIWRIVLSGIYAESNFEKLYSAGLSILLFSQAMIHIGMNAGLLPITGLGMPFVSYGGSSLISLFLAVGISQSFYIHRKGIFIGTEERYQEGVFGA